MKAVGKIKYLCRDLRRAVLISAAAAVFSIECCYNV